MTSDQASPDSASRPSPKNNCSLVCTSNTPTTMAATIPYTYIQCPCTSDRSHDRDDRQAEEGSIDSGEDTAEEEADFDPRSPRANYSLYPIENLLYCEICTQIRCQRCIMDEIVTWFCPNCLFEVPSSTVKSEGNRYVALPSTLSLRTSAAQILIVSTT